MIRNLRCQCKCFFLCSLLNFKENERLDCIFLFYSIDSTLKRIKVEKPVVDLNGDEMTRIIWGSIKEKVNFLSKS